jgi:hypothetical protein
MNSNKNEIGAGFLYRYGRGEKNSVVYLPLRLGFLKLEYGRFDKAEDLAIVSFVHNKLKDAIAVGRRLELRLFPGGRGDKLTFMAENAVSGLQWAHGQVFGGNTYDDDSGGPSRGRKVSLDDWVDECIALMINPEG